MKKPQIECLESPSTPLSSHNRSGAILAAFLAALSALNCSMARAEVLVYQGFHQGDWPGITDTASQQINHSSAKTSGDYSTGFDKNSSWQVSDNTTQISVSGTNYGLSLPDIMTQKGFTTCGGAAQFNLGMNSSEQRGGYHAFTADTLKVSSGTLYVRALLRLTEPAAAKLISVETPAGNVNGSYFGFGLLGKTSANRYAPTQTSNTSSCTFLMWKNKAGDYILSLCLIDASGVLTHYPLVTGFTMGETYLCYAEISVGAGADGQERVRGGAVASTDFAGAAAWAALGGSSDAVEVQLITDSSYPKAMAIAGPYGTHNGVFRADEFVVGTSLSDILPVGGVFSVAASGVQTVGTDSFETEWILVADEGVTADAGLVWSTDETFATATTNSLGTGLSADTRTATLSGLEPDTTYWWKIVAEGNGAEEAESAVASFTTKGAPVLGTATATADGETASFSVALATAAMENTLATSVSVFYGTDGETWTELPLGSASEAQTFSGTVQSLGYGVTYQWYAKATATLTGGRVLSAQTDVASFTTLYTGEMYVDAAAENATAPYSTAATAAPDIATALALATDGATIHVAPGLYPFQSELSIEGAIRIIGEGDTVSSVVVSNAHESGNARQHQRLFVINHAEALVANLTMQKGEGYGDQDGGNFYIGSAGGMVSNCFVEAGYARDNAQAAGGWLEAGVVTHTVFRGNRSNSGSVNWEGNRAGLLQLNGQARAENCLFTENNQTKAVTLINLGGSSVMRNCTIVDSGLSVTNEYCKEWSALRIASGATVQNVVIAGVTNTVDGSAVLPTETVAKFANGAVDGDISELAFPEGTITGTAASFFKDYANGNYTPAGPLVNKGANYEGMASIDLAGKARLVGRKVDIGCYEAGSSAFVIRVR